VTLPREASPRHDCLVLVPGLVCDEDVFAPQSAALASEVEVVVQDVSTGGSVHEMAEAVLDTAPRRFALAGFSMGGYVGWQVLRRARERVTALALLDTSARPDTAERTAERRALVQLAQEQGYRAVFDRMWPAVVAPQHVDDEALRERFWAMTCRYGAPVYARHQEAILSRPDSRPDMADVTVPTLVLCGRDDLLTPVDGSAEMASAVPGADLVVLGGAGHLTTWERPADVTSALRAWLRRST
jgi:pimeloyl-ACP methyl ester carboxylesterase